MLVKILHAFTRQSNVKIGNLISKIQFQLNDNIVMCHTHPSRETKNWR